ncbi:fimbrial protein [Photobacterium damselae]|uniref:fimbrial protein n=1 Tax=Photobacterium damselae TaxID=38293 RepID=UPI000D05E9F6|nr:fimbrial protein [Photobacterium damselae]PSB84770.1 type 1 fimbrial protein [Photobacterium damselae subsp. damselae]
MNNKATAILLGMGIATSAFAVEAAPNTINFQGEVTEQTCEVTVNGNTADPVVLLSSVGAKDLATAGATAGETTFTLGVTGCAAGADALPINTVFVGNNVDASGNLGNTGTATNVALQLLDASGGSAIDLTSSASVSGLEVAAGATEATHDFAVQYISKAGSATAGTVLGSVQYAIEYK